LEGDVIGERACEVLAAFLEGNENFSELSERFGISRKQGYKWRERAWATT
jgi:transposase-like protein